MRKTPQEFVFQYVYDDASMIEECLEDKESFYELEWEDQKLLKDIARFSRVTLLHRYIFAMISIENRHWYRKNADLYEDDHEMIREIENRLLAYNISFLPFKEYTPEVSASEANTRWEYPFYQWFLSQDSALVHLWGKVTDEVFHLLFGNRSFLLRFNQGISDYIKQNAIKIPADYLDELGHIRRVYLPSWVQRAVFFRDHGRCVLCQVDLSGLLSTDRIDHFDHIVPLGTGGVNDASNIQLLCEKCNLGKGDRRAITGTRYASWW